MSLFIGIDSGTQSVKAVVLDLETRRVVAEARAPHTLIAGLPVGHMEQNPQEWADAMDRVINAMRACGLPLWHPVINKRSSITGALQVVEGLEEFRQHLGGRLTLTMVRDVGEPFEVHEVDRVAMQEAIAAVRSFATEPA